MKTLIKAIFAVLAISKLALAENGIQYFKENYDPGFINIHIVVVNRAIPNHELRILARQKDETHLLTTDLESLANMSLAPVIVALNGYIWDPDTNKGYHSNELIWPLSTSILRNKIVKDCFSQSSTDCEVDRSILTFNGQSNGLIDINSVNGENFNGDAYYAIGSDWEILRDGKCTASRVEGFDARSAIGWAEDRIVFISTEYPNAKFNGGMSADEMCIGLQVYGATDGVLMDGGASVGLLYNKELKNPLPVTVAWLFEEGHRHIATAIALVECRGSGQGCSNDEECCNEGKCSNGLCAINSSQARTCPGGYSAGDYCGDVGLDQNPDWLYRCSAGTYSRKDTCQGGHCEVQPLGKNDFCVVEVSIDPVEPPKVAMLPEPESEPEAEPMTTSIPPAATTPPDPEPPQEPATTPEPATQPDPVCEPGDVKRQSTVCTDPITSEVVRGIQEMPCTEEGQWRGWWDTCTEDPPCSPPDRVETARCTATTVQTRICDYEGLWRNWSDCLPGELPEPDPGQNPDPDPGCACSSGACCNGCNYLPASATCEGWNLYRCVGQEVQGRQAERHCSGSSELCQGGGGQVEYTDWQYVETCAASEICQVLGSDGSYECANSGTCSITYTVNNNTSCYGNPSGSGAPTICLEVQQSNGSDWQWQVCKEGSKFGPDFSVTLVDQNHTSESLAELYVFSNSNPDAALGCTPWLPLSVSYLEEYGLPEGAAGIVAQVKSPSTCSQNACLYNTGTDITVRRECL